MILEIFGVTFGLVYLYLEIKQKNGMWAVGFIMAVVYAIIYLQQGVYASMAFQIYYVLVSVYGFVLWGKDKVEGKGKQEGKNILEEKENPQNHQKSQQESRIYYRRLPVKVLIASLAIYAASTAFMVLVLSRLTKDPMPFADSSITVLSAIATFWLSKSYREQWLVWLGVNIITVVMTLRLQLYPTALLYAVNAVASVYGYIHWKKNGKLISTESRNN